MLFSIRKKIFTALLVTIFLFMAVTGLIAAYNQSAYHKSQEKVAVISDEIDKVDKLRHAMEMALMPANDYIITGDKRYEAEFQKQSEAIERLLKDADSVLVLSKAQNIQAVKEERELFADVRISWENVKDISMSIFALPKPARSVVAARLMEEMDYKWGRPAQERLERWHEIDTDELKKAVEGINAAWTRSWYIMAAAFIILTGAGIFFASFYSRRFVRPIRELHNGAGRIAGGDLDYRVKVRTGDEIEQLAGQFNIMGEKLKEFYSVLEEKVKERTGELRYERDKLTGVFNAMVDGVYIVNKDYDIEYVNPVLEKEFGPYRDRKCYEYFHDRKEVCPWCPNQEVFKGRTIRWEWHSFKNGRTYDLIDTPLRNPDGTVSKLEIFRDITEKKQAEEELKARIDELERFTSATVGREFRIKELIDENKALKEKIEKTDKGA